MKENFTKYFLWGVVLISLFGVVLPFLISSKHTEFVILGIVIIVGVIYVAGKHIINLSDKKTTGEKNEKN